MEDAWDAYRILQVDPSAEGVVIQAAYRVLARRFHPDGHEPDSHRMAELNRAYAILRDPESRVAQVLANERTYRVLDELINTQPGVSYLKKVTFHAVEAGHA